MEQPRFLLDGTLGRLARNLRMFGLDAKWVDLPFREVVGLGSREGRWILTRRAGYRAVAVGSVPVIRILADVADAQVVEVLRLLPAPVDRSRWFWRCLRCNEQLEALPHDLAKDRLPDHVALVHRSFRHCSSCGRMYWPGTHRERMLLSLNSWAKQAWGEAWEAGLETDLGRDLGQRAPG